jgi:phosphoribosyl-AMP cyclohydrolase
MIMGRSVVAADAGHIVSVGGFVACLSSNSVTRTPIRAVMTIETTDRLAPRYDANGLVTAFATDAGTGEPLMLAHMNADALAATIAGGEAVFWSRSRARLWRKGEESGNVLKVVEIRIDCDQDAIWLRCEPQGPACHTGARTCFYRRVEGNGLVVVT